MRTFKYKSCILLTACVNPKGMSHTLLQDPGIRATQYKNALDFQLSSFLEYTISQSSESCKKKASYYIVTKDNGFNCLVDYWKKQGYDVYIVKNLMTQDEIQDELEYKVGKLLDDEDDIKFAVECIKNCETKSEVNAAMMKKYGDGKKVSQVYQAIKPLMINKL